MSHDMSRTDSLAAQPLIDELKQRLQTLAAHNKDDPSRAFHSSTKDGYGQLLSLRLDIPPSTSIKWHNDQLLVAWDGQKALNVDQNKIWFVRLSLLACALEELRRYMVLDDLAQI